MNAPHGKLDEVGRRPSFPVVAAVAVCGGIVIGVLDLWVKPTVQMFLAGVAAGVIFFLAVSGTLYLMPRAGTTLKSLVWCAGGALGGITWWFVVQPKPLGPVLAALVGLGLALLWLLAEGGFSRRSSQAA